MNSEQIAERDRLKNFIKFLFEIDEFGNSIYEYIGSDMFPTLESVFECYLKSE